jgi:hypothetical protein
MSNKLLNFIKNFPVFEEFKCKIIFFPKNTTVDECKDYFIDAGYSLRRYDFNEEEEVESQQFDSGYPDFIITKNGVDFYVEFKSSTDNLRTNQIYWAMKHPNKTYILAIAESFYYGFHFKGYRKTKKETIEDWINSSLYKNSL